MEDSANLDQLTLRLDENEELNALTLTTLLNSGVEEALSNLSPAQLIQLEKNVQKLKKQKTPITPLRKRIDTDSSAAPEKKRKISPASEDLASHMSRSTGGQYMNLPASAPHVEIRDGIEWLLFTYSTKGHIQEYCIRIDIDDLSLDEIPTDFKNDNCVYPRALVVRDSYSGNRFEYESSVNDLAWKLTWMNADVLSGKRGLIQRAVDSYRNRTPESRSRRVLRQQKLQEGNLRRRSSTGEHEGSVDGKVQKSITLQYTSKNGETSRIKLRVDTDTVNIADLDDDFRRANCLYPQAACDQANYGTGRYEYESSCNEIAWKLAWLNAGKLANQPNILQKAVDAYRARFETGKHHEYFSTDNHASTHAASDGLLTKGADFSEMVAHTLQQVLGHAQDDEIHSQVSLEDHLATSHNFKDDDDDDDFDHPHTVSTAELMGDL